MVKGVKVVKSDVSNRTVLFLLVLVIVASVLSLGVYMKALDKARPVIEARANGVVSLEIVDKPVAAKPVTAEAEVGVTIVKPKTQVSGVSQ